MKEITVLMAVYKEPLVYLEQSISSTINALSGFDYEFILIVDNPEIDPDVSLYIENLHHINARFLIIRNECNLGLAKSLNIGINLAKSKYIMRMDADDICDLSRVSSQFDYLENNSNVGIVGSSVIRIDDELNQLGVSKSFSHKNKEIQKLHWKYRSICFHPTWFGKTDVFKKIKYNDLKCAQDVEFLYRCLEIGVEINNLSETLLYYRVNPNSLTIKKGFEQSIIRYGLNSVYKKGSDFESLRLFLGRKLGRNGYVYWVFEKLHTYYSRFMNSKNYFGLFLVVSVSPLHCYKLFLLINSKFRRLK